MKRALIIFSAILACASAESVSRPPCPSDNTIQAYFADVNCKKFWECVNGAAVAMSCPDGLEFNPKLNVCDWPKSAGCTGKGWNDATTTTKRTTHTTRTTRRTTTRRRPVPCKWWWWSPHCRRPRVEAGNSNAAPQ